MTDIDNIELGNKYYYAKTVRVFRCVEVGAEQSFFKDYKGIIHQFYNEDMYIKRYKK